MCIYFSNDFFPWVLFFFFKSYICWVNIARKEEENERGCGCRGGLKTFTCDSRSWVIDCVVGLTKEKRERVRCGWRASKHGIVFFCWKTKGQRLEIKNLFFKREFHRVFSKIIISELIQNGACFDPRLNTFSHLWGLSCYTVCVLFWKLQENHQFVPQAFKKNTEPICFRREREGKIKFCPPFTPRKVFLSKEGKIRSSTCLFSWVVRSLGNAHFSSQPSPFWVAPFI